MSAEPCLIMVAPNGARKTKADHPALPITPAELAATASACLEAGAAAIHLHVRDRDGGHTLEWTPTGRRCRRCAMRSAIAWSAR